MWRAFGLVCRCRLPSSQSVLEVALGRTVGKTGWSGCTSSEVGAQTSRGIRASSPLLLVSLLRA